MPDLQPMKGTVRDISVDEPNSRFARIFEATTDVVAMTGREGHLLYLNAAGRKLLDLEPDAEISSLTLGGLHPEWAFEIVRLEGIPSAQQQGSWSGETALISATGREFPVLQLVLVHLGTDGTLEFVTTICRDISDRKLKELERIEWANRYNAAIQASGQVVFDWDTLSSEIAYGGEIEQLLGFSADEMVGGIDRLRNVVHPDDVNAFDDRIEVATMMRDPFDYTFRAIRKNGVEVIIRVQGCFFLDRHGQFGRMVGFLKDVTKERMGEQAIQLANERLEQRVAERTGELAKANFDLRNSALRQAAVSRLGQRALAGQSLGELMLDAAKTVMEMLPCEYSSVLQYNDQADDFKPLAEVGWPNTGGPRLPIPGGTRSLSGYAVLTGNAVVSTDIEAETRFQYSDASRVAGVRSGIAACIKAGERPLGVFVSFSLRRRDFSHDDVSFVQSIANVLTAAIERHEAEDSIRRARAEAEAANRAKSEFLSRMSHELRTPLNAILGFTQILEMEEHTENQAESIGHISRAGRNLLNLINEVLDIARLDSGRVEFLMESVDVLELIQETVNSVSPAAAKRNITIRLSDLPASAPFVRSDRERLRQILQNFLSNAVKFNHEGGSVLLTVAHCNSSHWRIGVTDTGIGIPQENLARLFVPFERLGTREGGIEGGSGLGLALCQRLITSLDGRIGVSSNVGTGSTFWVELPAEETEIREPVPTPALPNVEATPPAPAKEIHKILYIEDDAANYFLVDRFLANRKDIQLMSALLGSVGIAMAREHLPDLILLDLNLPDMDGEQILRSLRGDRITNGIRVVAVTGEMMIEREEELRALGVLEILVKPYKLAAITALLERSLTRKS